MEKIEIKAYGPPGLSKVVAEGKWVKHLWENVFYPLDFFNHYVYDPGVGHGIKSRITVCEENLGSPVSIEGCVADAVYGHCGKWKEKSRPMRDLLVRLKIGEATLRVNHYKGSVVYTITVEPIG